MSVDLLLASPALNDKFFSYMRLVEPSDADFICQLRSDNSLNQYISKTPQEIDIQREWLRKYKHREAAGDEFYFIIRHQEIDYGVIRMYDFRAEPQSFSWGSWIIKPSRPAGLVTYSAVMIYELGFDVLGFDQAHFSVTKENWKVVDFHHRSGATVVDQSDIEDFFVFSKDAWPAFRSASAEQIRAHRLFRG